MEGNIILLFMALLPFLGGLLCGTLGMKNETRGNGLAGSTAFVMFGLALGIFVSVQLTGPISLTLPRVCGVGISFCADGFRSLYGLIAAFMWVVTAVYTPEYMAHYQKRLRFTVFSLLTLGTTLGLLYADDLLTAFMFFELMGFTSYALLIQDEKPAALRMGQIYLAAAIISGAVMFFGLILMYRQLGSVAYAALRRAEGTGLYLPAALILAGYGTKAGLFPFHIWLPKASPAAAPASALLSGILTKTRVLGILVLSSCLYMGDRAWGIALAVLGLLTMVVGALLALFSIDLKRALASSSMSQIGFIVTGISMLCLLGDHGSLAAAGTVLHMVNHSLIKLILFTCAGIIYMNVHSLDINRLRGYGRGKPFLKVCFLFGALSIAGVPPFSGYISKTLLHEAIVEYAAHSGQIWATAAEWIFLLSGGITFAYMTKLFVVIFVEKAPTPQKPGIYVSGTAKTFLGFTSLLMPAMGILPDLLMVPLARLSAPFLSSDPAGMAAHFYSLESLSGAAISISIGLLLYFFVVRRLLAEKQEDGALRYVDRLPGWMDLDEKIYRPVLQFIFTLNGKLCHWLDWLLNRPWRLIRSAVTRSKKKRKS
ncbi:MAG: NADH dehydrogenase [Oscillospiraceae bacterium]|nr:NADH dehydrogenase [Oscillospiraceae bacterium]